MEYPVANVGGHIGSDDIFKVSFTISDDGGALQYSAIANAIQSAILATYPSATNLYRTKYFVSEESI